MALAPQPVGRRERNKQNKLERITAAAGELFAAHGVDEVTTQQIADKADIGTGTLFLYAKTKGELLLLVQNSIYVDALAKAGSRRRHSRRARRGDGDRPSGRGMQPRPDRQRADLPAGDRLRRPRRAPPPRRPRPDRADRGGDRDVLQRDGAHAGDAATLAHIVSAIMFVSMAATSTPPPARSRTSCRTSGTRSGCSCLADASGKNVGRIRPPMQASSEFFRPIIRRTRNRAGRVRHANPCRLDRSQTRTLGP